MEKQDIAITDGRAQTRQKGALPVAKLCLRPGNCDLRICILNTGAATDRGLAMIAAHDCCAIGGVLHYQVEHRHPVASEFTEKCLPLGLQRPVVDETCGNCLQVAVNVGE